MKQQLLPDLLVGYKLLILVIQSGYGVGPTCHPSSSGRMAIGPLSTRQSIRQREAKQFVRQGQPDNIAWVYKQLIFSRLF